MEAPKCRLCNERHWGACPVAFKEPVSAPIEKPKQTKDRKPIKTYDYRNKDERRSYMRTYMKKKRNNKGPGGMVIKSTP